MEHTAWLIETKEQPTRYYCAPGDFCDNPNHAHKFAMRDEAEARLVTFAAPENFHVTDHQWSN